MRPPYRFTESGGPARAGRGFARDCTDLGEGASVSATPGPATRSRVMMMCGPGGAGKTTYAKRLEREGWTRLSFEVEFWERGIRAMPSADTVAEVAAELKARLLRHVGAGDDVVLDFGFWFRRQRDEVRELLAPHSVVPVTVYLATSLETILSRIGERRGRQPDDWPLTAQTATEYFERFEPPTPEEGPLEVIR